MSPFEKIASVVIVILLILVVVLSVQEFREPREQQEQRGPNFDQSVGQDFVIGPFSTLLNQQSWGGSEDNCEKLQPVIVGVLHDIKEHLEHQRPNSGQEYAFEVNQSALEVLCNKNAQITLTDQQGNKLLLQKMPFTREVPRGGSAQDIGTNVTIDATVIPPGGIAPTQPTTFGEALIPDRYLDTSTSSQVY